MLLQKPTIVFGAILTSIKIRLGGIIFSQKQYVGNYRNWVFPQLVEGWVISAYKANFDLLQHIAKESFLVNTSGNHPESWGAVYNWYFLDIKMSERRRLETPCLTPGEISPASSRD